MEFSQIEYFEWVRRHFGKVKYNLATSGMVNVDKKLIKDITGKLKDWPASPHGFTGDSEFVDQLSNHYGVDTSKILTTNGTSEANFLVMAALVKKGDTVLVESPVYEPLFRTPGLLGAKVEFIKRSPQDKYNFDIEAIKDLISKNVTMIVITNPHNPSSTTIETKHLKELCDIAEDNKCHLLCDEVYREFVFKNPPKQACDISDAAISTNSMTKVFGLASLRTGWVFAHPSIIEKCTRIKYYTCVIGSPVTEKLAYYALKKSDKFIKNTKDIIQKNVPVIKKWVNNQEYLDLEFPKYGPFCFPRFSKINVTELSEMLINYYDTIIVPGKFFGAPEFARIGFGIPTNDLKAGLENIEIAVNAISK